MFNVGILYWLDDVGFEKEIGRMILVDVDHIGKVLENGFTIGWF